MPEAGDPALERSQALNAYLDSSTIGCHPIILGTQARDLEPIALAEVAEVDGQVYTLAHLRAPTGRARVELGLLHALLLVVSLDCCL